MQEQQYNEQLVEKGGTRLEQENAQVTAGALFPLLHRVMLVYGLFWSLNWLSGDLMGAFLRTMVHCSSNTDHCKAHPADCVPHDVHSTDWSGSQHCLDKDYVFQHQTAFQGELTAISNIVQCVSIPMLGTIADTIGRKTVMLMGFVVFLGMGACLVAASYVECPDIFLYMGAVLIGFNCFDPAALSMASDISPVGSEAKSITMGLMFFSKQLVLFATFGVGYWMLTLCLSDYSNVWIVYTVLCLGCGAICQGWITNTKPSERSDDSPSVSTACHNLWEGCKVVWQDKFVLGQVVMTFVNLTAVFGSIILVGSYCIVTLHYSQSTASLCGVASQPAIIIGLVCAKALMTHPRIGPYRTQLVGMLIFSCGHFCMWGSAACGDLHQPLWWLGFLSANLSYGLLDTSRATVISLRVPPEHQTKVQGAMQMCYALGSSVGLLLWPRLLYDAKATGLRSGVGFLASALVFVCSSIFYIGLMHFTAVLDPPVEVVAYDTMSQEEGARKTAPGDSV